MPYFYAGCLMLSRWKLRFAARLGIRHTETPETKIMFRIRRWAGIRKGTSARKVVKEKLREVGPVRAGQHSLTRSMPGSSRRRKRPRRTAHLWSRASRGLREQARLARPSSANCSSGPARGLPGALSEPPGPSAGIPPSRGLGAGGLGAGGAALSAPAALRAAVPPESAQAPQARVLSAHPGRVFVTPAPPSCSPEPHRCLPDTRVPTIGPDRGSDPRRSTHTSPGPSHASLTQAMPTSTTMGRQKSLIHSYRYCLIPFLF